MIVNDSLFIIEDQTEQLVQTILNSAELATYKANKKAIKDSSLVQEKQQLFLKCKDAFERIESFGAHAPDFREKQRAVRKAKRELDMCDEIADFRLSETGVQDILDKISMVIAQTISEDIKVDAGNPFFTKGNHHGCGGSCHAG